MTAAKESILWQIGQADGISSCLVDNYGNPNQVGKVIWRVPLPGGESNDQKWPRFHPSEADPAGDYRRRPYTIEFLLDAQTTGTYQLRIDFLVITPRLPYLEIDLNNSIGKAYLQPQPVEQPRATFPTALQVAFYSEGRCETWLPRNLLHMGINRLSITCCDGGDTIKFKGKDKRDRLDRIATGAGFFYNAISLVQLPAGSDPQPVSIDADPSVLYRKDEQGGLLEQCWLRISFTNPFEGGAWSLSLKDGQSTKHLKVSIPRLPFGQFRQGFEVADGKEPVSYRLAGTLDGKTVEFKGSFKRRRKWEVYVAPHFHTDIGYTHRQWEVAERHNRNLDAVLDLLEKNKSLAFHLDSSWSLQSFLENRDPAAFHRLARLVEEGRLGIPFDNFIVLSHLAALEDLVRNGEFSDGLLRQIGARPAFASFVDVPSLTSALPALLEGAGVHHLAHAANQDRGPFRQIGGLHRNAPFYWEGVTGGRVLVWLARMYCELRKVCGSPPGFSSAGRGLQLWLDEYEREDYPLDKVLLYGQEADNTDIDPQPLEFIGEWNASYAYPHLIPCAIEDYFTAVEKQGGDRLKVYKGDEGAYWEDGAGSTMDATRQARRAQAMLPAAERMASLAAIHHTGWSYPLEQFDAGWKQLLLFDEHTWGAFLSGSDPDASLQSDQWAVKEEMSRAARMQAERLLLGAISRHSLSLETNGREVVVFNPHNWPMGGRVVVEIAKDEVICRPGSDEPLIQRRVRTLKTQAWVEAWIEPLDGLSYHRFPLNREANLVRAEPRSTPVKGRITLENTAFRLVIDVNRGCAISWYDKKLRREMVDSHTPFGLGQFIYAAGGDGSRLAYNLASLPPGNPEVQGWFNAASASLEEDGLGSRLTFSGEVPGGQIEVEWTLPAQPGPISLRFVYHKNEHRGFEAGYVAFPLALAGARVSSDAQLGWVDWQKDGLPGSCKEWLPLQTGILAAGPDAGVFIASPDVPLFCVGDIVRGNWPEKLDLTGGHLFSYVFNNYWLTNYRSLQSGDLSFNYLLTSAAEIKPAQAFRLGWQARQPLVAQRISLQEFRNSQPLYQRPGGGSLAFIEPEEVHLSTLKKARYAPGYILRLQETSGGEPIARVSFPGHPIRQAWRTDLLEHELGLVPVERDGSLSMVMTPWELATVRIEMEQTSPSEESL